MRRLFLVFVFALLLPTFGAAQTAPDNDLILKEISDGASKWYYPNLLGRYLAGDTTLTGEDFQHLYYGFAFQDAYRPLDPAPKAVNNLFALFGANTVPNFDQALALAQAGEEALKVDPFNLQILNLLIFSYGSVDNREQERINYFRFTNVINTIKSSGTGLSVKSPWHVLTYETAHDMLSVKDLLPGKSVAVSSTVEYLPLLVKDGDARGYYFDYGRVYWKRPEQPRPPAPRGMGINGIPLK